MHPQVLRGPPRGCNSELLPGRSSRPLTAGWRLASAAPRHGSALMAPAGQASLQRSRALPSADRALSPERQERRVRAYYRAITLEFLEADGSNVGNLGGGGGGFGKFMQPGFAVRASVRRQALTRSLHNARPRGC